MSHVSGRHRVCGASLVGVVLIAGYVGARRFSEYRRFSAGISDRMLTQRLRELEHRALIERTVVPTMPVQITYAPTRTEKAWSSIAAACGVVGGGVLAPRPWTIRKPTVPHVKRP